VLEETAPTVDDPSLSHYIPKPILKSLDRCRGKKAVPGPAFCVSGRVIEGAGAGAAEE